MFRSGVHPRKFNCMENIRDPAYLGGVFHKGKLLQWIQMPSGLHIILHSCLQIKGDLTGSYVHATIKSKNT